VEGILVLKLLTDSLNLQQILDSIEYSLKQEGYFHARVQIEEAYTEGDTLILSLKMHKGFPFVSKKIKIEGYFLSLPSYRALLANYTNKLLALKSLEEDLNKLDDFYGNESSISLRGDTLIIRNRRDLSLQGNLFISDSIRGSITAKWDGLEIYYSHKKTNVSLYLGLPSSTPTALAFNYRKETRETYRLMLKRALFSAGIKLDGSTVGLATSFSIGPSRGRIEYLDGWTIEFFQRMKFVRLGAYYSQTDTTFVGGATDIAGYPEDISLLFDMYMENWRFPSLRTCLFSSNPTGQTPTVSTFHSVEGSRTKM